MWAELSDSWEEVLTYVLLFFQCQDHSSLGQGSRLPGPSAESLCPLLGQDSPPLMLTSAPQEQPREPEVRTVFGAGLPMAPQAARSQDCL